MNDESQPSWIQDPWFDPWALAALLAPFVLYWSTMAPSVTLEDSGEFITAAQNLGIPHPPGYPLWCLLVHPFTQVPVGNVAQRVHTASAFFGGVACLSVYLIGRRLGLDAWIALAGAWLLGASRYLWSQSVIAEVYSLNAAVLGLAVWSALCWRDESTPARMARLGLLLGLGIASHFLTLLVAPILGLYALMVRPASWTQRAVISGALAFLVGLSVYAYLPIRAAAKPVPNIGNPSTWQGFLDHVLRTTYATGAETVRQSGTLADAAQHVVAAQGRHRESFTLALVPVMALGAIYLFGRRRDYFLMSAGIWIFTDVLTNVLLQERFNASWSFVHRVYYIPSDLVLATWLSAGLGTLASWGRSTASKAWVGGLGLAAAGVLAWVNFPHADRRNDMIAEQVGKSVLDSMAPNSAVMTNDDFVYVLLYLIHVEKYRTDVALWNTNFEPDVGEKRFSAIYSVVPFVDAFTDLAKSLKGAQSTPTGMAYRLDPPRGGVPTVPARIELKEPPAVPAPSFHADDFFHRFAMGLVSAYYSRVGEAYLRRGDRGKADDAWQKAEQSAANAISTYTLAATFQDLKVHEDRVKPLLDQSLAYFDYFYDPSGDRFLSITRADIERRLSKATDAASASRP